MENTIQVFSNNNINIRSFTVDGEIYFVGKDIAKGLEYVKTSNAISIHVDDEDKTPYSEISNSPKTGQLRKDTLIINESGLYSLIMGSKLPSAKKFKRWVTSEVLPTLRKTGSYSTVKPLAPQSEIELIIASAKALQAQEARLSSVEADVKQLSTYLDGEIPPEVGYYSINSLYSKGKFSKSMTKRVIDKFKLRPILARKRVDTGQFQSYNTYSWVEFKKAQKKVLKHSSPIGVKQHTCSKYFGGQKFEVK